VYQCTKARISGALVSEVIKTKPKPSAPGQSRSDYERSTELGHVASFRTSFDFDRFTDRSSWRLCHPHFDMSDIVWAEALGSQFKSCIDGSMREVVSGVRLEKDIWNCPLFSQFLCDLLWRIVSV